MAIAKTYYVKLATQKVGELQNVAFTTDASSGHYTSVQFQYSDSAATVGLNPTIYAVTLSGPDASGNYTGSLNAQATVQGGSVTSPIVIHGRMAHYNQISFTFNPNTHPEFSSGHLIDTITSKGKRDDIGWDADSDSK